MGLGNEAGRASARRIAALSLAAMLGLSACAGEQMESPVAPQSSIAGDAEIRAILADRIDTQHRGVGIVVGLVSPQGRRIIAYGKPDQGSTAEVNGDTVFEIGSLTKIFTALLLADMARRGEVALDDRAAKYLPPEAKLPERNGRAITLLDLATQTSGLPFFPADMPPPADPAAARYTFAQLYASLAGYGLPQDIGTKWAYSNVGYAVLGDALARRSGKDYEQILRERIIAPLHMKDTAVDPTPVMRARKARGHDLNLQPAPDWNVPVLVAAGGLRSTANDMLDFIAAFAGDAKSPLASAMATMTVPRRPALDIGGTQALGWWVIGPAEDPIFTHDGGTIGFASTLAYDPKTHVGIVVLSNAIAPVSDIARHLLRPSLFPMAPPQVVKLRTEIAVEPAVLDRYAGRYRASAESEFVIERSSDGLTLQLPNLPKLKLHAESDHDFFVAEADIQVTFKTDAKGQVTGIVLHLPNLPEIPAARERS